MKIMEEKKKSKAGLIFAIIELFYYMRRLLIPLMLRKNGHI